MIPRIFKSLRGYLASSSSNPLIDTVLDGVRCDGFEFYDFRASGHGPTQIFDPERKIWTPNDFVAAITEPIAYRQFNADKAALDACDVLVLLEPCGNDAHDEAGYASGRNIPVIVFLGEGFRPGLMLRLHNGFVTNVSDLLFALTQVVPRDAAATGNITSSALDPFPAWRYAV